MNIFDDQVICTVIEPERSKTCLHCKPAYIAELLRLQTCVHCKPAYTLDLDNYHTARNGF